MKNLQSKFCHDFKADFLHFNFLSYWPIRVTKMIITRLRINTISCSWCHIKAPAMCYIMVPSTPYCIFPTWDSLCTDEYRSTRTHVKSYPCQLVPMSTRTTNRCQLVPQVMSTRTQQGKYQMMVRVDIYYHTIDVNSYPCQLVPMSTRIHVNSYH